MNAPLLLSLQTCLLGYLQAVGSFEGHLRLFEVVGAAAKVVGGTERRLWLF